MLPSIRTNPRSDLLPHARPTTTVPNGPVTAVLERPTRSIHGGPNLATMHRYEELRRELADMKPFLASEYHVSEIGIFGSYARGEQTEESDLDVLVAFDGQVSLLDLVRLENELGDRLGVDVVTKRGLKPRVESRVADDIVYV